MKRELRFIFILLFTLTSIFAQRYPINIVPRVQAPSPVNFFNYADETSLNSPITVQLFLNDLTVSNRQIRLKTYFEGGNINFTSNDFVLGAENLFIEGGVPLTLTNVELAPYFKLENISGISPTVYGQAIPEGSYDFCFEIFDYISGAKLSDKVCRTVFIFKNEPPILNVPFNKANIEPKDFENIVFQWTPRHINVTNVEYQFSLVEIWDDAIDPQTAFLSQAPIYEETTRATTLLYGPDKPLLLSGKRYAWRVKAKALQGLEEIGLFKNEGFSEVFWFSRTEACKPPENITAEAKGLTKINVFWDQDPSIHSEYTIAYREADKPNAYWFTKRTNSSWATIWNLKAGTKYEYKVKGKCTYQYSEYSEVLYVTTDQVTNDDANYNCGIVPDAIAIENREPHPGLYIGDQITAGDFRVTITNISNQSNGIISGNGFVAIPYLSFAKFAVTFNGILVNSSNQLAEGEIVTLYDPEFGEGASMTVDVNVDISEGLKGDGTEKGETVEVDFTVTGVEIDANGAIVVTGTGKDGKPDQAILPGNQDVSIVSANGEVWEVGEDGKYTKQEGAEGGIASEDNTSGLDGDGNTNGITAKGVRVTFEDSGYYHYDALPKGDYKKLAKEYMVLPSEDGDYNVPYKAISDSNGKDFINARVEITDSSIVKDSIIFKTKAGAKVPVLSWDDNIAKLSLQKKFHFVDEEVLAVVKSKTDPTQYDIAGTLLTTHLASQELAPINITVVPVYGSLNRNTIDERLKALKKDVEEIYKKSGVQLNVQFASNILPGDINGWNEGDRIEVGDSNVLSHYTASEKIFNKHIKQQTSYTKNTYYVFLTDIQPTKSDVKGFMPLKRQFGFVFDSNIRNDFDRAKTMAHELGHGIFGLEHPWKEYDTPEGATKFLMDNGDGTLLNHMDWKKIHAPGIKIYWFQDDEDGESVSTSLDKVLAINEEKYKCESGKCVKDKTSGKYYFGYLTPSGERIVLSEDYMPIFYHGISSDKYNKIVPGTLIGFKKFIKGDDGEKTEKKYLAEIQGGKFTGYDTFSYVKPDIDDDENESVIIGLPYGNSSEKLLWKNYKFKNLGRGDFEDGSITNIVDITSDAFKQISLFNKHTYFKEKTYTNTSKITGDGQIDVSKLEIRLLGGYYNKDVSLFFDDLFDLAGRSSYQISHNERREVFLIVKIAEIYNRYPHIFKEFTKFFDNWDIRSLANMSVYYGKWDIDNLIIYSDDYKSWKNNFKKTINSSEDNLEKIYNFYQSFLIELLSYINEQAAANNECLSSDFEQKTGIEVFECIRRASQYELEAIKLPNKVLAIKKILEIPIEGDDISDDKEVEVARLLQAISEGNNSLYDDALSFFKSTTVTYTYVTGGKIPVMKNSTVPLWYALFNNIEDQIFIFGENNRQSIVKSLGRIFLGSKSFEKQLKASIDPAELMKIITIGDLNNLHNYFYTFENDYQNILRRGWSDIYAKAKGGPVGISLYDTEDFYKSIDTKISESDFLIDVEQKVKWGLLGNEVLKAEKLEPFQLVSFINISKNNLLKPFTAKDEKGNPQAIFVPALTMHYASKTDQIQTKSDIIITAVDLLAFLPSGGTASLNTFGKFLYYADKVSSVASMTGTAFREVNPELSGYMNQLSLVSGVASLASLSTFLKSDILNKKNLGEIIHPNALNTTNNPVDNINELTKKIVSDEFDISKLTPEQARVSRKFLDNEFKRLKAAPALNAIDVEKAIAKFDEIVPPGINVRPASVVDANLVNKGDVKKFLAELNKKNIDDDFIDIVIHGAENKFIIDLPDGVQELETLSLVDHLLTSPHFAGVTNFRLLSCSNMELAEELISLLPKGKGYTVRATDDIVRIHADGGISTVPRGADNPPNQWEDLTTSADGTVNKKIAESPKLTSAEHLTDFIELGRRSKAEQFLTTIKSGAYPDILKRLDELKLSDDDLLRFANDFKNASKEELAILGKNNGEIIDVWKKWGDPNNDLVKLSKTRISSVDDLVAYARVYNKNYRRTSFDDFFEKSISQIELVVDKKSLNYKKFAVELFEAWDKGYKNNKSIAEMQKVYKKYDLDPSEVYPPNEGTWGLIEPPRSPKKDELFDRFQRRPTIGGSYAGALVDPDIVPTINARSLKENYSDIVKKGDDYYYFVFKFEDIPSDLKFEYGEAMAWFDKAGGATQIKSSKHLHKLEENIVFLEKWKLVDGKWVQDFSILKNKFPENLRKLLDDASDEFFTKINTLSKEGKLERFIDDFKDNVDIFLEFKNNDALIDSWNKLSIYTTPKKEWIRKNIHLLKKMSKQSDEIQEKIVEYYRTFQKPSTSGAPPFPYTTRSGDIVQYDNFAQPRFEPFIPKMKGKGKVIYNPEKVSKLPEKNFPELMGSSGHDIADANRWIKQEFPDKVEVLSNGQVKILNEKDEWITCVWHHHEDGRNIIPVPIEVHNRPLGGASHTGGNSIIDKGLKDFFDPLKLDN